MIADQPIDAIVTAPAHRRLRNPTGVRELAGRLASGESLPPPSDPIRLDVFTEVIAGEVEIRVIECVDGNHRLAAIVLSGFATTIGELPPDQLSVRVNGWAAGGVGADPRWIPLEAARRSTLPSGDWFVVPDHWGAKGPTAQIPGGICSLDDCFALEDRGVTMAELISML